MFQSSTDLQLDRVRNCPQASMLGEKVYEKFGDVLNSLVRMVTDSTVEKLITDEAAKEDPVAASFPTLLTKAQRQKAWDSVKEKVESGALTIPKPLTETLDARLACVTDAFLEMLSRMEENRQAVCDSLTGGRLYRTIDDIILSAGDTHNFGRSVTILHTDAGKLVYKPHDIRGDEPVRLLAERFFPEYVGIPKSVAFKDRFGVCEFIEKRRAEGKEEAAKFFEACGGLTAFVKMFSSTDLHVENIIAQGAKSYILDLETVFSPGVPLIADEKALTEADAYLLHSPHFSLLMPARVNDFELSILNNKTEYGSLPVVDGKRVTVREYLSFFEAGYHAAYTAAAAHREEIAEAVRSLPPGLPIRIVPFPTRGYWEILKKLYHYTALESEEGRERTRKLLKELLMKAGVEKKDRVAESELKQLFQGDIPYFYTFTDSRSLFGGGEELVKNYFTLSAAGRTMDTLSSLSEEDERFDLAYIDRAVRQYPEKLEKKDVPEDLRKILRSEAIGPEEARKEALRIFHEMYALNIPLPGGKTSWGYTSQSSYAMQLSDRGLFNGYTGIAVFSAACAYVSKDAGIRKRSDDLISQTEDEIHRFCRYLKNTKNRRETSVLLGECSGFGGILKGLALLRRYCPDRDFTELTEEIREILENTDFSKCMVPDRINGAAGLVSALCRFEEYRGYTKIIRAAAGRLLELKTFRYKNMTLWQSMPDIPRALCGAGHGMSGIAEALYAASELLGEERFIPAAGEALSFEQTMYRQYAGRIGTFPDLRVNPPTRIMHGYCSGAPGTGIMMRYLSKAGLGGSATENLAGYAEEAAGKISLNLYDHLCCGNSAAVEYRLSTGSREEAGKLLGVMYARRQKEGSYRFSNYDVNNSVSASLFNGLCGVGYEMLRYADPDRILSIL